jgi:hypothetical protein
MWFVAHVALASHDTILSGKHKIAGLVWDSDWFWEGVKLPLPWSLTFNSYPRVQNGRYLLYLVKKQHSLRSDQIVCGLYSSVSPQWRFACPKNLCVYFRIHLQRLGSDRQYLRLYNVDDSFVTKSNEIKSRRFRKAVRKVSVYLNYQIRSS